MYIYKITNNINGKEYIGYKTKTVNESKNYYGSGIIIKHAIKKYGKDNFSNYGSGIIIKHGKSSYSGEKHGKSKISDNIAKEIKIATQKNNERICDLVKKYNLLY